MASIAEMLLQSAQKSVGETPDLAGSLNKGAELALKAEEVQQRRAQIEGQRAELQRQKLTNFMDAIEKGAKFEPSARRNYFGKILPRYRDTLGLTDMFPDETLKFVTADDGQLARLAQLRAQVERGDVPADKAIQMLSTPEFADVAAEPKAIEGINESYKSFLDRAGRFEAARATQAAQAQRQETEIASTGRKELAKDIAKAYGDYQASGGKAGIQSSLQNLEEAASALETGQVKTGGLSTKIPGFKSDSIQSMINPKLLEVRTQAQTALNTVLRATLGSQFTEREGERVLNQVWDDKLAPAVNAKKIRTKIKELKANVKNAETEFKRQGFPVSQAAEGTAGASPALDTLTANKAPLKAALKAGKLTLDAIAAKAGVSVEEVQKILGD